MEWREVCLQWAWEGLFCSVMCCVDDWREELLCRAGYTCRRQYWQMTRPSGSLKGVQRSGFSRALYRKSGTHFRGWWPTRRRDTGSRGSWCGVVGWWGGGWWATVVGGIESSKMEEGRARAGDGLAVSG